MISRNKLEELLDYVKSQAELLTFPEKLIDKIILETSAHIQFCFPGQTTYLELIRRIAKKISGHLSFTEEELDDIGLALDEACSNIILFSYQSTPDIIIKVGFDLSPHQLKIIIEDNGISGCAYNPFINEIQKKLLLTTPCNPRELSSFLINKLMDHIDYEVSPGVRNQLKMIKYVTHRS